MIPRSRAFLAATAALVVIAIVALQIPGVSAAAAWRAEKLTVYVRNLIHPVGPAPTALPVAAPSPTPTASAPPATQTDGTPTSPPSATPEPLATQVSLPSPPYEFQTPNNCGPAALSMALHMYGWEGSQADIAERIKPELRDRNVNPEELAYFVRNFAGWLSVEYRVGGDLVMLQRLLAAGYPVIVESVTELDPNDRLNATDDLWSAHYMVVTGYDTAGRTFTVQDSYHEPDRQISFAQLEADWEPFNHLYMVLYFPEQAAAIAGLFGAAWDADQNRLAALEAARSETEDQPDNAFGWFNLGSNLVYFERYEEAAIAYDTAREIGLPMRMFRYQFGPFLAYFHSGRNDDLLLLTDYARGVTEMSEEAWLWYGWGLYRQGDMEAAVSAWNKALSINNSSYVDARLALQGIGR